MSKTSKILTSAFLTGGLLIGVIDTAINTASMLLNDGTDPKFQSNNSETEGVEFKKFSDDSLSVIFLSFSNAHITTIKPTKGLVCDTHHDSITFLLFPIERNTGEPSCRNLTDLDVPLVLEAMNDTGTANVDLNYVVTSSMTLRL